MNYVLELDNPKTIPLILRQYHFEKLNKVMSHIEIDLDMRNNACVVLRCKDEFWKFYIENQKDEVLKNDDWDVLTLDESHSIKVSFNSPMPSNSLIQTFGGNLADLLLDYIEYKKSV